MLDHRLVEQVVVAGRIADGRIELLLLQLGVDLERKADTARQCELLGVVAEFLVVVEPGVHFAVVLLQQGDGVGSVGGARTGRGGGAFGGLPGLGPGVGRHVWPFGPTPRSRRRMGQPLGDTGVPDKC